MTNKERFWDLVRTKYNKPKDTNISPREVKKLKNAPRAPKHLRPEIDLTIENWEYIR